MIYFFPLSNYNARNNPGSLQAMVIVSYDHHLKVRLEAMLLPPVTDRARGVDCDGFRFAFYIPDATFERKLM